jgi:hypothetical protein
MGFLGGDDVPAVSLHLIGTDASFDGPQYSVPRFVEGEDNPAVMSLMDEVCKEVANALVETKKPAPRPRRSAQKTVSAAVLAKSGL